MDKELFERLVERMTQMNEIVDGSRVLSREFVVDAIHAKERRKKTGLTQSKFCQLIDVNPISNDPIHILAALAVSDDERVSA